MPAFEADTQTVSVAVHVNPLVNWVWFGFGLLAIGTGLALLPETALSYALAKVPAGAATTSVLLLALLLTPGVVSAQGDTVRAVDRSAVQRRLENDIMCLCGCRAPMGSCPMRPNCPEYTKQSARVGSLLKEGQDYDAVRATFVREFGGQAVLTAPIDRGFNRLAWIVPYAVGVLMLGGILLTARRWSHAPSTGVPAGDASLDPTLNERLDDELRDLD
jgi:hypothetical protein